jgi:hypothetical protein
MTQESSARPRVSIEHVRQFQGIVPPQKLEIGPQKSPSDVTLSCCLILTLTHLFSMLEMLDIENRESAMLASTCRGNSFRKAI